RTCADEIPAGKSIRLPPFLPIVHPETGIMRKAVDFSAGLCTMKEKARAPAGGGLPPLPFRLGGTHMEWSISNQILTVAVGSLGGGLTHLQKGGVEYLWQGDPAFWTGQAPHLFPIVGRLTGGKATVEGDPCSLGGHGFFRKREAALVEKTDDSLTVEEVWDEETYAQYPRKWRAALTYRLEKNTVLITFHVENLDEKTLWFYYGGHPGFRMPLEDGLDFCDYRLKFSEPCAPKQMALSDDFFTTGDAVPFPT